MKYVALILILFAGTANAKAEKFKCQAGSVWFDGEPIVVIATIHEGGETGSIQVAGVSYSAWYTVKGFDRRWDFGLQDDLSYDFAFLMKPSGLAVYYDFSAVESGGMASGDQIFSCK